MFPFPHPGMFAHILFAVWRGKSIGKSSFRASKGNRRSYSTLIIELAAPLASKIGLQKCRWICYDMVESTLGKYWASCTNGEVNGVVLSLTCKQWMICAWRRMEMNGAHMSGSMTEKKQKCRAEARFPWISHISQPAQHASWHPNRWPKRNCPTHDTCSCASLKIVKKMSSGASPCIFFSISAWPQHSTAIHSHR